MKTLVHNGTVISFNSEKPFLESGYVTVDEAGNIDSINPGTPSENELDSASNVINAHDGIIMPGLINAHNHFYRIFGLGMPDVNSNSRPQNYEEQLNQFRALGGAFRTNHCAMSSELGSAQAAVNGVTTLIDQHYSPHSTVGTLMFMAMGPDEAGLRANVSYGMSNPNFGYEYPSNLDDLQHVPSDEQDPERISSSAGLMAPYSLNNRELKDTAHMVQRSEAGLHVDLTGSFGQDRCEKLHGQRIIERLDEFDLLTSRTLLAHAVDLTDREIALIANRDAMIVHTPRSNMNHAIGDFPLHDLLDAEVVVGLGTDGLSTDLWRELEALNQLENYHSNNPASLPDQGLKLLAEHNPTIARRLHDAKLGKFKPGWKADIIILDYDAFTPVTEENYVDHLVNGITSGDLQHVLVSGEQIVTDGEYPFNDLDFFTDQVDVPELWNNMGDHLDLPTVEELKETE